MNEVIFCVSEEDATETFYKISSYYRNILDKITNKNFGFYYSPILPSVEITSDDKALEITPEIANFLHKFRNGKYNKNWTEIANFMYRIDTISSEVCHYSDYYIFLHH